MPLVVNELERVATDPFMFTVIFSFMGLAKSLAVLLVHLTIGILRFGTRTHAVQTLTLYPEL